MSAPLSTLPPSALAQARIAARNLRSDLDLTRDELLVLLELAADIKAHPRRYAEALRGTDVSLLFEKPSLRTRLTFELAAQQLGAGFVTQVGPIAEREPLKDVARNLARWTKCIVARTFTQRTVEELAHWGGVPVVNALSDLFHPCQAIADVLTIRERFGERRVKVAFVGDGNNVAHSLMLMGTRLGYSMHLATPKGYEPDGQILATARGFALENGATVEWTGDPVEAVRDAQVVYTDVWTSMGQEAEALARKLIFQDYQVNAALMRHAPKEAVFLHCLPAKRGQEVTDEVIESPQSAVFDQAENRLHGQKALLHMLLA
jgi:ornithine carbamoyltransferase